MAAQPSWHCGGKATRVTGIQSTGREPWIAANQAHEAQQPPIVVIGMLLAAIILVHPPSHPARQPASSPATHLPTRPTSDSVSQPASQPVSQPPTCPHCLMSMRRTERPAATAMRGTEPARSDSQHGSTWRLVGTWWGTGTCVFGDIMCQIRVQLQADSEDAFLSTPPPIYNAAGAFPSVTGFL